LPVSLLQRAHLVWLLGSGGTFSPVDRYDRLTGARARPGGGVTQIVMPYITVGIAQHQPESVAWRYAFLVPACAFVVIAFLIMTFTQARPPRPSLPVARAAVSASLCLCLHALVRLQLACDSRGCHPLHSSGQAQDCAEGSRRAARPPRPCRHMGPYGAAAAQHTTSHKLGHAAAKSQACSGFM